MYKFKYFLVEAKIDDFINRYAKYHSAHPLVVSSPEEARNLVKHAHQFAQGHDESIFLTKHLLDGIYKPGEDDESIKSTLGKWRKAKTEGLVGGKLSDHTHDSISAIFADIPQLNLQKRQAQALAGMEKYRVGEIEHPKHGNLTVYQVRNKKISGDKEYENISDSLRKTCSGSSWCVLPRDHGPLHLKHYSHGPGIFFYVNKNGSPVLSHGFGDRGIVRPDNSVIGEKESQSIIDKTHKILPKNEQEGYDFFHRSKTLNSDPEYQSKMYDEFGGAHAAAHFLDPKVNTHPKMINRIIDDNVRNKRSIYETEKLNQSIIEHKNFSSDNIDHILNLHQKDYESHQSRQNKDDIELRYHFNDSAIHHLTSLTSKSLSFSDKHMDKIFDLPGNERLLMNVLHNYPKMKLRHLKKSFSSPDSSVRSAAIKHFKADDDMYHQAIMDDSLNVVSAAIRFGSKSKKLKDEHFNKLFDRLENGKLHQEQKSMLHTDIADALHNDYVSKETFDKAVNYATKDFVPSIAVGTLGSKHLTDKHIDAIQQHYSSFPEIQSIGTLLHTGKAKSGLLDAFVSNPSHQTLRHLSRNTGLKPEQYTKLIDHLNKSEQHQWSPPFISNISARNLFNNPSLNTEHIRHLYSQVGLRASDAAHDLIKSEKLPKDIYDKHFSHILGHVQDPIKFSIGDINFDTGKNIVNMIQSPHFESKHLDQILESPALKKAPEQPGYLRDLKSMTSHAINTAIGQNKFNSNHLQKIFDIKAYEGNTNPFAMGAASGLAYKNRDPNYKYDPKIVQMVKSHPDKSVSDYHEFMDNNFNSEKLHKIIQSGSEIMALTGFMHPLVKSEHHVSALKSPHESVRNFAKEKLEQQQSSTNESIFVIARKILCT